MLVDKLADPKVVKMVEPTVEAMAQKLAALLAVSWVDLMVVPLADQSVGQKVGHLVVKMDYPLAASLVVMTAGCWVHWMAASTVGQLGVERAAWMVD